MARVDFLMSLWLMKVTLRYGELSTDMSFL